MRSYAELGEVGGKQVMAVASFSNDGWLAGIYEVTSKEWRDQTFWPDMNSAQKQLEHHVRNVLGYTGPIIWTTETFSAG